MGAPKRSSVAHQSSYAINGLEAEAVQRSLILQDVWANIITSIFPLVFISHSKCEPHIFSRPSVTYADTVFRNRLIPPLTAQGEVLYNHFYTVYETILTFP